jgi:hypothetical protein
MPQHPFYFPWPGFDFGNTFRVDSEMSLHVLLRLAARNATARIRAGIAMNNPKIGRTVNEITKKIKPIPRKIKPSTSSATLSQKHKFAFISLSPE